jgi:hypothetical protein
MSLSTLPIHAELVSLWDGGKTIVRACTVDVQTGVISVIENPDEEECFVQSLTSRHLAFTFTSIKFPVIESSSGELSLACLPGMIAVRDIATSLEDSTHIINLKSFSALAGNPAANTRLIYQYRDGANYKSDSEVVFPGAISVAQLKIIADNLLRDEGSDDFLPLQVDLDALCPSVDDDRYDDEFDHCVHTVLEIGLVLKVSDYPTPISDFVNKFAAIGPEGWDMQTFGNLG